MDQMLEPMGVYIDNKRNILWVSDTKNYRVLKFSSASSLSNGTSADGMFGETGVYGCSSTNFASPIGLVGDVNDNLWVADNGNSRVLRYLNASTKVSGSPADFTIGDNSLSSCRFALQANQTVMDNPSYFALDPAGTLYVSDSNFNRVLGFLNAASINTNGPTANFFIGQPRFTSSAPVQPSSATSLWSPSGLAFDSITSNSLLIADYFANRVLRYCSNNNNNSSSLF